MGRKTWRPFPHPELRPAAGGAPKPSARTPGRGRGLGLADAGRDPLGLVGGAPLGPAGGLVGDLDLDPFAGFPRHPARFERGGARTFPVGDQPVDWPWLALFAARSRDAGLDAV